jgi:hypothetical protein
VNQTHVVIIDGYDANGIPTYSGMNSAAQFRPVTDTRVRDYVGFDFILLNPAVPPGNLQDLLNEIIR